MFGSANFRDGWGGAWARFDYHPPSDRNLGAIGKHDVGYPGINMHTINLSAHQRRRNCRETALGDGNTQEASGSPESTPLGIEHRNIA